MTNIKFVFPPEEQVHFQDFEHFVSDGELQSGLEIRLAHWHDPKYKHGELLTAITIDTGRCHIHASITPEEALKLANLFYDFAATSAAHSAQIESEHLEAA